MALSLRQSDLTDDERNADKLVEGDFSTAEVVAVEGFDEKTAVKVENTIAGLGRKARDGDLAIDDLQGGTFTMGCTPEQEDDCGSDEKPSHEVYLDDFFKVICL